MSGYLLNYLLTAETKRAHRATWWVYTGAVINGRRERIRHQATMKGPGWGYDVVCSCGQWESHTGGATRGSVESELWDHRFSEQSNAEPEEGHRAAS